MQLRKEAWKIQDFNGVWTRDLVITGVMLYQLSYEATDVGSRSIVGSYVPVKEMSVNDIWNKSYINCGNEMKMKKWSSQWMQFMHCINYIHCEDHEEMIIAVNAIYAIASTTTITSSFSFHFHSSYVIYFIYHWQSLFCQIDLYLLTESLLQ